MEAQTVVSRSRIYYKSSLETSTANTGEESQENYNTKSKRGFSNQKYGQTDSL
jgi:hypothetical protein